ncbi:MAG: hypothetical protein LBP28_03195, partial [Coriobacteriales bacterium]|nr:hypothetical protein [Coriobacteriales bacterium]
MQMEAVECGAASLAMVAAYYGKIVPLEEMRVLCGVTRDGVNALNIIRAARSLGFEAQGFKREPAELAALGMPLILHWNFEHFVVLEGFVKDRAYINDPALGHYSVSAEEFSLSFTGIVIQVAPGEEFKPSGQRNTWISSLSRRLRSVRSALLFLFITGLLMVVPGLLIPTFSRVFIDDVLLAGRSEWLGPLLFGMLMTVFIQALVTALRQRYLLRTNTKIAIVGAGGFFWHLLRLPVVFYQQRSVGDISSRMSSNDTIADFLSGNLANNVINALTLIFYLLMMLQYSVVLSLISLLFALGNVVYFMYSSAKIEELNRRLLQDRGTLYGT